jgi:hypothetical protein
MAMLPTGMRVSCAVVVLLAWGCAGTKPHPERSAPPGFPVAAPGTAPLVSAASVVAFWLSAADTVPDSDRIAAREAFRRSNERLAKYLSDTDILLAATVSDTVVIQLVGGSRRVVMLSGLDFPYGYLLIEPGYAEEFHTGVPVDEELLDAIDDYFGLEADTPGPRHRIAHHAGPRVVMVSR